MTLMSRRYQPNVSQFLALCGRNYHRILLWMKVGMPDDEQSQWQVSGQVGTLNVKLLENTRYTQLIEVSRPHTEHRLVSQPKVLVRIYHDAQLAEVLTSQHIYQLLPVYHYPNPSMHQPNEKYQINAFLEELLKIGCHDSVTIPTNKNAGK
ncbi:MAG: DUF1249 domain-containing protein [Shewanella sp.]|nr:DUF1249 domain-containing protein [Shewanella sp.]